MSLSKKNLDKLNYYIKNKNLSDDSHIVDAKETFKKHKDPKTRTESEHPNEIFYKLIDNTENISETSKVNHLLRKSEENTANINAKRTDLSMHLTTEDELYDEFNYLLEE